MKRKVCRVVILILSMVILFFISYLPASSQTEQDKLGLMISRLERQSGLEEKKAVFFRKLTPLLFDYLRATLAQEKIEPLYNARSMEELGILVEEQFGKNIIEFGEKMFVFFEAEAVKDSDLNLDQLSSWDSEHFVFFTHPGSAAEQDIELIKSSAEQTYSSLISCLEIKDETEQSLKALHTAHPGEDKENREGRIAVYLHQVRKGKRAEKVGKNSFGSMSLGATILESGEEKGWGRLTAVIDILYFNAFSLVVLDHEIAHAVLFLGSFDPEPLLKKPLKGEADLRKAFFAGYKPISPFLHEGIGDYVIYYHTFYRNWPILPKIEKTIQSIQLAGAYIPLNKLVKEDRVFRMKHHKEYTLQAASFINYLIQTYGRAKLKEWFLNGKDALQNFEKIYKLPLSESEKEWLTDIGEKAKSAFIS